MKCPIFSLTILFWVGGGVGYTDKITENECVNE